MPTQRSTMKGLFCWTFAIWIIILDSVTCADALTSVLDCTFEESACQWQNEPERDLEWERHTGRSVHLMTGPSTDHTLGTRRGHFMSFSTAGRKSKERKIKSSLKSPLIPSTSLRQGACFQFWYYMHGSFVGELKVLATYANASWSGHKAIWTREGSQGPEWKYAQFQLPKSLEDTSIIFQATAATGGAAVHAAVDDIVLTQEDCEPNVSCDFETGFCGYEQSNSSDLQWIWGSPNVDGNETGVHADHTLGSRAGHFLYLDLSSTHDQTRRSSLTSPVIAPTSGSCFYFWYKLLSDTSEVSLEISFELFEFLWGKRGSTISLTASTLVGYKGQGWQLTYFNVTSIREFQVSFLVRSTPGKKVILSIDDLDLVPAQCPSMDICHFEHSHCSWQNLIDEDNLNWIRGSGGNLYTVSSTRIDHTLKTIYGKYLLLDSNARQGGASTARLISKRLKEETEYCLSFWYLMEASHASKINIELGSRDKTRVIHTIQNQKHKLTQSHLWKQVLYKISPSSVPFHLVIEGVASKVGKSDIALDDLLVSEGRCPLAPSSVPKYAFQCQRVRKALTYAQVCDFNYDCSKGEEEIQCGYDCDFENSRCKWRDNSEGNAYWSLANGHTYSRRGKSYIRGLSRDHTKSSSQGHFMVVSNGDNVADESREGALTSPVLQRSSFNCKMTFYYVITKPGTWSMSVEKERRGHAMTHFHLGNTTARYWRRVMVSLGYTAEPFQISIRVRNLKGSAGTIAVDDVRFKDCDFPLPSSSCSYWNRFQCRNGACVNSNVVCNFEDNCGDNTDEHDDICTKYTRCDFEEDNGVCGWAQEEMSDDFDWSLANGKSFLKPMPDHTTGFSSGHFIKITGHSRFDGDRARLLSSVFENTRNCKMSFYVIINGTELDMVNVYTRTGMSEALETKLTVNDVNGVYWIFKTLSIASDVPFQIILEGILGKGEHRYIAIDDISLSPECVASRLSFNSEISQTTEVAPSPCSLTNQWQCQDESECIFLHQKCDFKINCADKSDENNCGVCDFESSSCGWSDISRGKYTWDRMTHTVAGSKLGLNRNQPIARTNKAMTLKDGGSMYVRISLLKSPEYGFTEPTCSIFFHFFLKDNGQLSLYAYPSNTSNFESTEFGYRLWHYKNSAHWRRAAVNIGSLAAGFVLVFRYDYKKGSEAIGSAIDDVSFSPSCSRGSPPCEFQCQSTDRCVPLSVVCDMAFDCRHGDDEMHCGDYQRFDFERDVGSFTHDANSDFYWKRTSWSNEKWAGVPVQDHTIGTSLGHFLSVPMIRDEIFYLQKARMLSPIFHPNSDHECSLRFFYQNGDYHEGVIRVFTQIHENGELSKVWETRQPSQSQWHLISLSLNSSQAFRVIIEGTRSPGYQGGVAIDDVSFTPGCIQTNSTSLDRILPTVDSGHCLEGREFSCDFKCVSVDSLCDFTTQCTDGTDEAYCPARCDVENGICSWMSEEKPMPWEIGWAKLYEFNDHTMKNDTGHFVIVKSVGGRTEAKLSSPLFSQTGPDCSFSFWYRTARKVTRGDVNVYVTLRRNGYDELIWMHEINAGSSENNKWKQISVGLPPCMGRFQVSFNTVFGLKSSNDSLVLDDISFNQCSNQPEPEDHLCQEETHFQCGDGRCISRDRTCDSKKDCCDGRDEDISLCFGFIKFTFESGLQGWTNRVGHSSQWAVQRALKDGHPDREFPLYDHTELSPLGKYLTMSRAKHVSTATTAALVKEMPAPESACTVVFWYQMTGKCIDLCSLSMRIKLKGSEQTEVHSIIKSDVSNVWLKDSVPIDVRKPYEIIFEGFVPAAGSGGHVNLDDIVFSPGCADNPPPLSTTLQPPIQITTDEPEVSFCQSTEFQCVGDDKCIDLSLKCNFRSDCTDSSDETTCGTLHECEFDDDKCFWSSSAAARSGWRTTSDLSSPPHDGPVVDANGKHGNYVYIYESETRKSEMSRFTSPVVTHSSANCVLKFHYFSTLFQNSTLSLEITNTNLSVSTTLWQTSQSEDIWSAVQVGIGRQNSSFRLSFRVSSPENFFVGFVALDKIKFEYCSFSLPAGPCSNDLYTCNDGACVGKHSVCDYQADCFDQSDEQNAFCMDVRVIDFEDSEPLRDFEDKKIGQLSWSIWNRSIPLSDGALGVDHSTGSSRGHFLYASASSREHSEAEAWIFSPELRTSNLSKEGCKVTFYALIPSAKHRLKVGYCLPDESVPRASLDVYSITGSYGSFWQKVSFRIFEQRSFQLIFIANPESPQGLVGIDDIIYGRNCISKPCMEDGKLCETDLSDNVESRLEPVFLAKTEGQEENDSSNDQILALIGSVFGFVGVIVIITGIVVYLHTMKIIGKPSRWSQQEKKDPKASGYLSMDDNGSVQGEMYERSSISI